VVLSGVVDCVASADVTVKGACADRSVKSIKEVTCVLPTGAPWGTVVVALKLPLLSVTTVTCEAPDGSEPKNVETGIPPGQPLPVTVTVVPGVP
jgi:hypothetical protein